MRLTPGRAEAGKQLRFYPWNTHSCKILDNSKSDSMVVTYRDSLTKKELKRQQYVEHSPSRNQQLDSVNSQTTQRTRSREKREGRGSPPPLNRPFSLPLDAMVCTEERTEEHSSSPSKSPLTRYRDIEGIKKKAERWRERQSDDSSPEMRRRYDTRKDDYKYASYILSHSLKLFINEKKNKGVDGSPALILPSYTG